MRALLQNPLWARAKISRSWQRLFGSVSGVLLTIAMIALADGLIAQMRSGSNELDILPGESLAISGPAALKNPLPGDIRAVFNPEDAPLSFTLEGFFTGYWFGSGMWRALVTASDYAETGRYELRVSFKGASALNAQKYFFNVYADAAAQRQASLSLLRRLLDVNAFLLAAWTALGGILCGIATYFFGRAFARDLRRIGLAQIYASRGSEIFCLAPQNLVPQHGNTRLVLNADGTAHGEARVIDWKKGKLRLELLDKPTAPENGFICLRHPESPQN